MSSTNDELIRQAAIARVRTLSQVYGDDIPWSAIAQGFDFNGEKLFLAGKAVGIFKPKQMQSGALSIKTTKPRPGRVNEYNDAEDIDGTFIYSLQGREPDDSNNRYNFLLQACWENQVPVIYLHAVAEGVYKAIFPCFIEHIDEKNKVCRVSVAAETSTHTELPSLRDSAAWQIERRYALRETKSRLHQAEFRERVLGAYGKRCAMSGLPVPELLEAAHIMPDAHELGTAEVQNGICLSRIHHRAFDSNLIGVTPDYKIYISERLMKIQDGVILEGGLKALHGQRLDLPNNVQNWPSKELLDRRFEEFKNWIWS
jgi:putative restriction endonuclease